MILHNYDISPYSEMIRLMLGHSNIDWRSDISPPYPPRKIVDPLTGGYRRIPVAQIGADLFCDTRIICSEIANISGMPELSFESVDAEIAQFANQTNSEYFMPIVQTSEPKSILKMLVTRYWPWQILALMKDRAQVAKSANGERLTKQQMIERMTTLKQSIESKLAEQDFLFGSAPSVADFAAYHLIWFADLTRSTKFLKEHPKASKWQARMNKIGHGNYTKINQHDVFNQAKNTPRPVDKTMQNNADIGKSVSIAPVDYARDSVEGELVGSDDTRWIVARQSNEFGLLHVHFPRDGYALSI